eukprot:6198622-Pleurochrysis_carterae.AAC.2
MPNTSQLKLSNSSYGNAHLHIRSFRAYVSPWRMRSDRGTARQKEAAHPCHLIRHSLALAQSRDIFAIAHHKSGMRTHSHYPMSVPELELHRRSALGTL